MPLNLKQIIFIFLIILGIAAPAFSGAVPDTGITKCYDRAFEITCPSTGEDYYGQDANYTINPMSYTKLNGGIMVKDNVTGLIWEVKQDKDDVEDYTNPHDADNVYKWYNPDSETNGGYAGKDGDGTDTYDFINALNAENFGGYNDWRMPTREELRSLADYSISHLGMSINTEYFPNTVGWDYWSSSTYAPDTGYAWYVEFCSGSSDYIPKKFTRYVRAVRSEQ